MAKQKAGASSVGVRTKFYFQIITTPTSDTPGTSLLLHFDTKRYILGEITEGTQRACIQRGVGLKKVRALFLAGKTHWNNGGLIGMLLTLAGVQETELDDSEAKRPRLDIHAGPMQLHGMACARRFVFRTGMPLSVHEVDLDLHKTSDNQKPVHEDENIRVWALTAQDSSFRDEEDIVNESQLQIEQQLRKEVVNNMFDSDWRRDRLFEAKLKDIKLPAIVYVRDVETKALVSHAVFDMDSTSLSPEAEVLHRNPWPASAVEELPLATGLPRGVAMSYIIKGHPQRGSFDVNRAKALGLNPGPKFAILAAGRSIESEDGSGKIITPEMVLSPTRPASGLALFDVPSVGHLDDLVCQLGDRADGRLEGIEVAVWMTRGKVLQTQAFQELLHQMKDMKHIISDASLCNDNITHDSSALSTSRLAQIAPSLFPIPRFDNSQAYNPVMSDPEVRDLFKGLQIIPAQRGLKVQVEPTFDIDESEVAVNFDAGMFAKAMEPAVQELLPEDTSLHGAASPGFTSSEGLDEPEIITLGTGSAAPSKYRNVSAVLLRMPNGIGNYLFDCGEGTLGQLKRLYNAHQLDEILFDLRAIWISHLHADHHLGTVSVLQAVHKTVGRLSGPDRPRPPPPYLLSEINMLDYMDEYQSVLGISSEELCTPVPCDPYRGLSHRGERFDIGKSDPYIRKWRGVKVSHCHGAQAVSVTFKNGFKFSYSGDCRPSEAFCGIGADSDVLVHEATFDDGMEGDAMAKKHSTTGEAVGVALGMRAKNLILTHFSQRYQKIPVIHNVKMPERVSEEEMLDDVDAEMTNGTTDAHDEVSDEPMQELAPTISSSSWVEPDAARELPIAVAFDLMRIKVSQIKHMKALFPAIQKMFEIEDEKRDKAKREAGQQQKIDDEQKRLDRLEAMASNREKKKVLHREKQMEANQGKKSKRNKRKVDGHHVDNGAQTRTMPTTEPAAEGEGRAVNGSGKATLDDTSSQLNATSNGAEAVEKDGDGISVATNSGQNSDKLEVETQNNSMQASKSPKAAAEQQEPLDNTTIEDTESHSAIKRRKTE